MDIKVKQTASENEFNLANERVGEHVCEFCEVSLQSMLDSGLLINVTGWATREMAFPKGSMRVTVALTARLWRVIHKIPKELTFFQSMRGRGHEILWLAAWVLRKAKRFGDDSAVFMLPLVTDEFEEDMKLLRVEYRLEKELKDQPFVTIGLAEEFPLV